MIDGTIYETGWKSVVNSSTDIKHIYTCIDDKCFVAVATRSAEMGFDMMPITRGTAMETRRVGLYPSDEKEARKKVEDWVTEQV